METIKVVKLGNGRKSVNVYTKTEGDNINFIFEIHEDEKKIRLSPDESSAFVKVFMNTYALAKKIENDLSTTKSTQSET